MQTITVQQANPGFGSLRYRKTLMDCESAGPKRCVKTKFCARPRSERASLACAGMNQSINLTSRFQKSILRAPDFCRSLNLDRAALRFGLGAISTINAVLSGA